MPLQCLERCPLHPMLYRRGFMRALYLKKRVRRLLRDLLSYRMKMKLEERHLLSTGILLRPLPLLHLEACPSPL
jgi:hypothetical protein